MRSTSLIPKYHIDMKYLALAFPLLFWLAACGGSNDSNRSSAASTSPSNQAEQPAAKPDDGKGVGAIKEVELNSPLKAAMVDRGEGIYEMKCASCHKLTDQRVVGPGWKGITDKRKPEWIMNMITNVEVMLAEDSTAQALLEECLVRMPNQNLSIGDARDVLEFMYANDGQPVGE